MKTLLALTAAALTTTVAIDSSASPRTDQFLDEHKTVGLPPGDQIDRDQFGNGRGRQIVDEGKVLAGSPGDRMNRETMTSPRQREAHNMDIGTSVSESYDYDDSGYYIYESESVAEPPTNFEYQAESYETEEPEDMEELDDFDYTPDDDLEVNEEPEPLNEYPDDMD